MIIMVNVIWYINSHNVYISLCSTMISHSKSPHDPIRTSSARTPAPRRSRPPERVARRISSNQRDSDGVDEWWCDYIYITYDIRLYYIYVYIYIYHIVYIYTYISYIIYVYMYYIIHNIHYIFIYNYGKNGWLSELLDFFYISYALMMQNLVHILHSGLIMEKMVDGCKT